ncbi:MAG TPA: hypothetical protein VNK95_14005 [Caldilineaceae bacterium]|nr:hypothetical protein [Caldilineaceae bacterium]
MSSTNSVGLFVLLTLQSPSAAPLVEVTPSTNTPTAPGAATSEPAAVTPTSPPPTSAPTVTVGSVGEPPNAEGVTVPLPHSPFPTPL